MTKRLLFLSLSLILLAGCTQAPKNLSQSPSPQETALRGQTVSYYESRPEIKGYLSIPDYAGSFPAVILIHQWWGLSDDIRHKADDLASQGYVALAVDLYNGVYAQTTDEAIKLSTSVRENPGEALNNLRAAMDYVKNLDMVNDDELASVGWCFGGDWSYAMAKNNLGTKVSIIYYGHFNAEDDLSHMNTLILGHFGAKDTSIPVDDVKNFQTALEQKDKRNQIYIYDDAGHAFANTDSQAYVEDAANLAWDRSLEFLNKYLK
jgi:carboxymethylenebutenolidase